MVIPESLGFGEPRLKMISFLAEHPELDEAGFRGMVEFSLANDKPMVTAKLTSAVEVLWFGRK